MYPVVDTQVPLEKLRELESAMARGPLPRHMQCSLPLHSGWNAFHEVLPDDQGFNGEDPLSLGLERAGAPPFEHNMGLYHLDSLLLGDPRPLSQDGDGKSGQGKQEARDEEAGGFEGGGVNPRKSGIPAHRLGDFFFNMGGELTSVQEDAMALFSEAAQGQLAFKAVAWSNLFTASNALCCWQQHAQLSQHQHDALRNASLCLKGVAERCWGSRAIVVPSIDALAQDLDLDELLILHKAWADWFYSRVTPVEWRTFGNTRALGFPNKEQQRIIVVYASSHTWMNHGDYYYY
jgi:hypothetical protein